MPEPAAAILLYHGVSASPSRGIENFSRKHIHAEEFERQMAFLNGNTCVVSLREIAARLAGGWALAERSVAVTFDDSFKNNLDVALPILKRHRIPATFFVATGFVGTDRRFWVDRVEHCLNVTERESIPSPIPGDRTRLPLTDREERIAAVVGIKGAMKSMTPKDRDATLARLVAATGVTDNGDDVPNYANLSWDDVRGLDDPPSYEVGGHTVNHEILAYLPDDDLEWEIAGCVAALSKNLGRPVDLFSYPEGQSNHFDARVIAALKRAGVAVCPSAIHGFNRPGEDPFHLRRITVGFMGTPFPFPEYAAASAPRREAGE